ncbi:MAG: ATP-binding protein [Pyrinomonadaceae bacterium]
MRRQLRKKIFARCGQADFVGRDAELQRISNHAISGASALTLLSAPSAGASELLRQIYDRLFVEQTDIIPFYFEFKPIDESANAAALRFLKEFLLQTVAFRRRDIGIIDASPEICEVAELAVPSDGYWIDRLIESCHSDSRLNNDASVIKNCLSAPLRAAANGTRSLVMIDSLDVAFRLDGGDALFDDIRDIATKAEIPFVLAGKRRPLHGCLSFESTRVEQLAFDDAIKLIESLSAKMRVDINDQTRDLIAVQTGGVAGYIVSLFHAAAEQDIDLATFNQVAQVYTDEIFGGRTGKKLDKSLSVIAGDAPTRHSILRLLAETATAESGSVSIDYWKKQISTSAVSLGEILTPLHDHEIINLASGHVAIGPHRVVHDFINSRVRMEIDDQPRALAVGESLAANIKAAPMLMARHYRRNAALGLREFLTTLNGQKVAAFLIDYGSYKSVFKGEEADKILKAAEEETDKIALPKIVYSAHASAVYPRLDEVCEPERAAIAIGTSEDEKIVLLAAEIDSKLEASVETTSFWCDRLEMVAAECGLENYRLWLIAPEGFADAALALLSERKSYGSSRKQIELLAKVLGTQINSADRSDAHEYNITVPMGEDTELIAAHTIEEIARRHNVPQKTINQIKTALVEACINATEHSMSPDRKIHQSVRVDADKITITISNRGVRLEDKKQVEQPDDSARRGWGLRLMRQLMDDVQIEQTDDGTRITLVKFFNRN